MKIHNEMKIITAPGDVFTHWSEVISSAAHGELLDPDTVMKFNEKLNWKPENKIISREFFKWLGILSINDLAKLAKHILNQDTDKRKHPYPKVTMSAILSVLESCFASRDWVERQKQKQLVKRELHHLDREVGLFNPAGELVPAKWKEFKKKCNITCATMNVLLERPGEDYFAEAKQVKSTNKKATEISPYAAEFFRVFLDHRQSFVHPSADAHYQPYIIKTNHHAEWPRDI